MKRLQIVLSDSLRQIDSNFIILWRSLNEGGLHFSLKNSVFFGTVELECLMDPWLTLIAASLSTSIYHQNKKSSQKLLITALTAVKLRKSWHFIPSFDKYWKTPPPSRHRISRKLCSWSLNCFYSQSHFHLWSHELHLHRQPILQPEMYLIINRKLLLLARNLRYIYIPIRGPNRFNSLDLYY